MKSDSKKFNCLVCQIDMVEFRDKYLVCPTCCSYILFDQNKKIIYACFHLEKKYKIIFQNNILTIFDSSLIPYSKLYESYQEKIPERYFIMKIISLKVFQ